MSVFESKPTTPEYLPGTQRKGPKVPFSREALDALEALRAVTRLPEDPEGQRFLRAVFKIGQLRSAKQEIQDCLAEALYTIFDLDYTRQGRALYNTLYQIHNQGNPEELCALSLEIAQALVTKIIELPHSELSDAQQKLRALNSMIVVSPNLISLSKEGHLLKGKFILNAEDSCTSVVSRLCEVLVHIGDRSSIGNEVEMIPMLRETMTAIRALPADWRKYKFLAQIFETSSNRPDLLITNSPGTWYDIIQNAAIQIERVVEPEAQRYLLTRAVKVIPNDSEPSLFSSTIIGVIGNVRDPSVKRDLLEEVLEIIPQRPPAHQVLLLFEVSREIGKNFDDRHELFERANLTYIKVSANAMSLQGTKSGEAISKQLTATREILSKSRRAKSDGNIAEMSRQRQSQ